MTHELPLLRLGLAGFSADQVAVIAEALDGNPGSFTVWEIGEFQDSDGWWINGGRTQLIPGGRIRVGPASPTEKALQLQLSEVDRPLAFAKPLPETIELMLSFDLAQTASMHAVLDKFEESLAPVRAQFLLAAHILQHESALGRGIFDVTVNGSTIAVVDMHGEAGVEPTVTPADFEAARWARRSEPTPIPENFARGTISQLMWQYALRTQRDVLPPRYRMGMLYYRRPPRLPQRVLKDSHLLLLRELMVAPATFRDLEARSGIDEVTLARELAALYFVGSITANAKRAAASRPAGEATIQGPMSGMLPSDMQSVGQDTSRAGLSASDMTVPALMDRRAS